MSLSWRDRYCAALKPDRVELVRIGRGWSRAVNLSRSLEVATDNEEPRWVAALAALRSLLEAEGSGRGDLSVVVSNHFVRYLVIPWDAQIGSIDEYEAYLRIAFENVFGDTAASWTFRSTTEKAGAPRLAAAIDGELDHGLRQLGAGSLRLVSVQPYLMAAFNALSQTLRRQDFFFLLAEPGRACVLAAVDGYWRTARNQTVVEESDIPGFVERELRLLETSHSRVPQLFVHAPELGPLKLPLVHGVAPHLLNLIPSGGSEAHIGFPMAMSAA